MSEQQGSDRTAGRGAALRLLAGLNHAFSVFERLVVAGGVLLMAVLMSSHVLGRLLFNRGIPGTTEITEMLIIVITFIGVSYGARQARHISMSAVYDQLSGTSRKVLLIVISVGTAALMFYFAWKSAQYTLDIYARGRVSSTLRLPMWIVVLTLPVGFTLAGVQYGLTAIRNLVSDDIYRSFTEKEEYAELPMDEAGDDGEGAADDKEGRPDG